MMAQLPPRWPARIEITNVDGVTVKGPCWIWHGYRDKDSGYGRVTVNKKLWHLHRFTYELFVGPIPPGLHIDHLCRQRACCAPHHLEPVTCATNVKRGMRASQTHCKNGHPLSGDNMYLGPGSKPAYKHRTCRTCRAVYMAEWKARRKQRQEETWAKYLGDEVAS
jgi:hypothetical protein